jgi:peptidoglycan/LPS O-acetylase OafA/YrhL
MPAEAARLQRTVGSRDRRLIVAAACAVLAAGPAALVVSGRAHTNPAVRCISTLRAGFMGGATATYCGARAANACHSLAKSDLQLADACRREGIPTALAAP